MARKRSTHFLPYEEAQAYVQKHQVKSRSDYWRWHRRNNVDFLPRYPNRHYKQWESWNTFLGTNNSFEANIVQSKNFRPFWEAVRWSQKAAKENGIRTARQWVQFHKEGNVPSDIPRRPDQYYKEFIGKGWGVWLGKDVKGRLMSEKQNIAVLAVCTRRTIAQNIVIPVIEKNGIEELKHKLIEQGLVAHRLYHYHPEDKQIVEKIFSFYGGTSEDGSYVIANVDGLFFELDTSLEMIRDVK